MEYPRKANGSINFTELSRQTGVNATTLSTRYKRGLRGKDLLEGVPYAKRKGKKLTLNGKEIPIYAHQETQMKQFRLNKNTVQQRLDQGWNFDDAIGYPPDYILFDDLICLQVMRGEDEILIPSDTVDELIEMKVNISGLKRVISKNQKPLHRALPKNVLVFKNRKIIGERYTSRLIRDEKQRREYARKKREERQRAKRPWLYDGTPQPPYARDKYTQWLMDTSIFPKKAVR